MSGVVIGGEGGETVAPVRTYERDNLMNTEWIDLSSNHPRNSFPAPYDCETISLLRSSQIFFLPHSSPPPTLSDPFSIKIFWSVINSSSNQSLTFPDTKRRVFGLLLTRMSQIFVLGVLLSNCIVNARPIKRNINFIKKYCDCRRLSIRWEATTPFSFY